ncbi:hypothetical protein F5B19DRAFT_471112 [Rostrohypoxylon terebratum]|nr:hypothetical protein F5B19DRAFT_471112 [Rostrohypoxylon terebratum]
MSVSPTMNVKARRKATPNTAQGWLPPLNSNKHRKITFDSYHSHLLSIAKAIHAANVEFLAIVEEYLRWRAWSSAKHVFGFSQKPGRYTEYDLNVLKDLVAAGPPVGQSAVPQLLDRLRQTSYMDIWRRATENVAYLKSHPRETLTHVNKGRKRAERLKACRVIVETSYGKVENELRNQMLIGVCEGVLEKIAMLREYEDAYPVSSGNVPDVRFKLPMPTLLCCSSIYMTLSTIPAGIALIKGTNAPGSTDDPDFWWLVQSVAMQLLGLVLAVCNVPQKPTEKSTAWTSALCLTAFGMSCTCASIPTYLFLSTSWSNFMSSGATMSQIIVMLELTLMADHSKIKQT